MSLAAAPKGKVEEPPKRKGKKLFEGYWIEEAWLPWHFYLWMFGTAPHGEAKLAWWKKFVTELWPEPAFFWDEWADLFFGGLCGAKETVERVAGCTIEETEKKWWTIAASTGAASTGKSSKSALWILGCYLCAQKHTSCILTSTSLDQLQRRIWSELCEWIQKSKHPLPLDVVPSATEIRCDKGDKKNAIFGIAVKSGGDVQEAVDRIKGIHNRRVFVVIDEATAVAPAITLACGNLNKGTLEYQLILLANAVPGENQHTAYCEPVQGWNSVTVDHQFWLTKKGGFCAHFDGHRSPALRDPHKFHFYIKQSELDQDRETYGGENTPEYWTNDRGFWPPTGLSNTVMDTALLNQFQCEENAIWKASYSMAALIDPAFEGGDRRVMYPIKWGEFSNGITGIEFQRPIILAVDMTQDVRWIHYQISDAIQRECEDYKVGEIKKPIAPENVIQDTTGEGGGLFSVLSGRWSPLVQSCEFGGAAEKVQIAPDRPTTYYELYGNRVTMLWYVFRRFVEGSQIRGLIDSETRTELTTREKYMKGGKTHVQPKREMKGLKHRSPDKADAAVLGGEFLRRKGIMPAGKTGASQYITAESWNRWAERLNLHDSDHDFSEEGAFG